MSTVNFNQPVTTDLYTAWPTEIQANSLSLGFMLDPTYVTGYTGLVLGMKRLNSSTGLFEQWSGSAWATLSLGYLLDAGDTMTGTLVTSNNIAHSWKDSGSVNRTMLVLSSANNFLVGDSANGISGGATKVYANTNIDLIVNAVTLWSLNATGMSISQPILSSISGETLRLKADAGYISGYNTANSTRTGYLQFNTAASVILAAENGSVLTFSVAGGTRWTIDTTGALVGLNSASYVGHNGTTGSITVGANATLADSTARIEFYDTVHATLPKQLAYRGDVHSWTKAAAATSLMTLDTNGNLLVGSTGALYNAAGRGVIEINGSSSLLAFKISGSAGGYVYHDGTNLQMLNTLAAGGGLIFGTGSSGTTRLAIDSVGRSVFAGSVATTPSNPGSVGGAVTLDCKLSNVIAITLTSNMTGLTLSNLSDGQTVNIFITQDGTGSRTMSGVTAANGYLWPGGTAGVLSTAANAVDLLVVTYRASTGKVYCTLAKGFA